MSIMEQVNQLENMKSDRSKNVFAMYLNTDPTDPDQQGGKWKINLKNGLQNLDRKSTRLNSSHVAISYAVFCLKKKKKKKKNKSKKKKKKKRDDIQEENKCVAEKPANPKQTTETNRKHKE